MTCRLQEMHKGNPAPRTCPECGLGKHCARDYVLHQITEHKRDDGRPAYVVLDPDGKPPSWVEWGKTGVPASVLIAQGKLAEGPAPGKEPIPEGIYFNNGCFYSMVGLRAMGYEFWHKWIERRDEFPTEPVKSAYKDAPAPDYTELNEIPPGYYFCASADCFFGLSTGQPIKDGEWADKWRKVAHKFPQSAHECAKKYPGIVPFYEHPGKLAAPKGDLLVSMKPSDLAERITAQKEALEQPRLVERDTGLKLSRVQRAQLLDALEEALNAARHDELYSVNDSIEALLDSLIEIIDSGD